MSDLRDLYQEMILDHSKSPRQCRALDRPDCTAEGHNPLCGDRLKVYLRLDGDRIAEATFEGSGCAISVASASMMSQAVQGLSTAEAEERFRIFHRLLTGDDADDAADPALGKLACFAGVRRFPVRVKCATLAWHTLRAALERGGEPVTTE